MLVQTPDEPNTVRESLVITMMTKVHSEHFPRVGFEAACSGNKSTKTLASDALRNDSARAPGENHALRPA